TEYIASELTNSLNALETEDVADGGRYRIFKLQPEELTLEKCKSLIKPLITKKDWNELVMEWFNMEFPETENIKLTEAKKEILRSFLRKYFLDNNFPNLQDFNFPERYQSFIEKLTSDEAMALQICISLYKLCKNNNINIQALKLENCSMME